MLRVKCTKFDCSWGSIPDPAGKTYSWWRGKKKKGVRGKGMEWKGGGNVFLICFGGLMPLMSVHSDGV